MAAKARSEGPRAAADRLTLTVVSALMGTEGDDEPVVGLLSRRSVSDDRLRDGEVGLAHDLRELIGCRPPWCVLNRARVFPTPPGPVDAPIGSSDALRGCGEAVGALHDPGHLHA
jgi:hypothetical protein